MQQTTSPTMIYYRQGREYRITRYSDHLAIAYGKFDPDFSEQQTIFRLARFYFYDTPLAVLCWQGAWNFTAIDALIEDWRIRRNINLAKIASHAANHAAGS